MFTSDQLIFLHLQKAAGSAIVKVLDDRLDGTVIGGHTQLLTSPNGRIVLGAIRDPQDWYASLWSYGCSRRGTVYDRLVRGRLDALQQVVRQAAMHPSTWKDAAKQVVRDTRRKPDYFRDLYDSRDDPQRFRQWLAAISGSAGRDYLSTEYAGLAMRRVAGFMTFRVLRLFCDYQAWNRYKRALTTHAQIDAFLDEYLLIDRMIRVEYLNTDLAEILFEVGALESGETLEVARLNTSSRLSTDILYDAASRAIIVEREGVLLRRFGYCI